MELEEKSKTEKIWINLTKLLFRTYLIVISFLYLLI